MSSRVCGDELGLGDGNDSDGRGGMKDGDCKDDNDEGGAMDDDSDELDNDSDVGVGRDDDGDGDGDEDEENDIVDVSLTQNMDDDTGESSVTPQHNDNESVGSDIDTTPAVWSSSIEEPGCKGARKLLSISVR